MQTRSDGDDGQKATVDEGPATTPVDRLQGELRQLAALRSPAAVGGADLPTLRLLIARRFAEGASPDGEMSESVARLLDGAIASIPDPLFGAAAEALLGSGAQRWQPLHRRGEEAASVFGVSWDGYRRPRRSTSQSLLDETTRAVAIELARPLGSADAGMDAASSDGDAPASVAAIRAPGGGDGDAARDAATKHGRGTDDGGEPLSLTDAQLEPAEAAGRRRVVRRRTLVGAGLLMVLVGIGAFAVATRDGGSSTASADDGGGEAAATTATGPSAPCKDHASQPTLAPYERAFLAAAERSEVGTCLASAPDRWGDLVVVHLERDGKQIGVLVASTPDKVLRMSEAQYGGYHQVAGKDGSQAQAVAGLPVSVDDDHAISIVRTEHGGVVSAASDQPAYFVGLQVWDTWNGAGRDVSAYGLPTSNPLLTATGYHQDFTTGYFTLPFSSGKLVWTPVRNAAGELPEDVSDHVLRHSDGTSWYVDANGVRHWIPDGETYECVATSLPLIRDVTGYAVATVPLGEPASCPESKSG